MVVYKKGLCAHVFPFLKSTLFSITASTRLSLSSLTATYYNNHTTDQRTPSEMGPAKFMSTQEADCDAPRAGSLKSSLGLRLMLFGRTFKEALSAMKHPPHAKETTSPTARDLKDSPLCLGDVSADDASQTTPQRNGPQQARSQQSNPSASSSHGTGFQKKWECCDEFLSNLVQEAEGWSKLSEPAGDYFDHIADQIEGYNIRLHTWGTYDIDVLDSMFGDSSPSDLMDHCIHILEEIMFSGKEINKEMELLGSLACQGLVVQTKKETGVLGSLVGQESVGEMEEEMKILGSLTGQQSPGDLGLDL